MSSINFPEILRRYSWLCPIGATVVAAAVLMIFGLSAWTALLAALLLACPATVVWGAFSVTRESEASVEASCCGAASGRVTSDEMQRPLRETVYTRIPIAAFGASLSVFLALSYTICVLAGFWFPDAATHIAWLQFFPGVTWMSWQSYFIGLAESLAYGWYIALVFGSLFNMFAARTSVTSPSHGVTELSHA